MRTHARTHAHVAHTTLYLLCRAWAASTRSRAQSEQARLEHQLTGSKTSLKKESIRQGHIELANHFLSTGDIQVSFACQHLLVSILFAHVLLLCRSALLVSICLSACCLHMYCCCAGAIKAL